ncbi:expressed unknown protein [Seminavis robusta]|uniref:CRAL-TRIO domain-containing protein n=1 Tax=Seminavis robusta TaxID=568900 RepID=A0A9N8HMV3_9STRA|nr:expressed unknown protein [Seminavis robusta]|eukprot:Sro774_g200600.1 n/a (329) ;mRNA; r:7613-8599
MNLEARHEDGDDVTAVPAIGDNNAPVDGANQNVLVEEDDESDNSEEDEEDTIPRVIENIDDPRRMKLTQEERVWALEIKEMIENSPELDTKYNDFMYAQMAIITKGDLEDAMNRAHGLQDFRREYKILDTLEQGHMCMKKFIEILPLHWLSFSFSPSEGTYILVHDVSKIDTNLLNTVSKVETWMAASYYLHTSFSADMACIRRGCISMAECEGMDWTKKQDFKLIQAMISQLLTVYPFIGEFRGFHTGTVFNVLASILRRILPSDFKDTFRTGYRFEGRLDSFYLIPDVPTANRRLISRLCETLKRRYDNEQNFFLTEENGAVQVAR